MHTEQRWAEELAQWALPAEIVAQAPQSPWRFAVEEFTAIARGALADPPTPAITRAAEALPDGGVLLDVGAGAGAASLPLATRAGRLVAVDESGALLDALTELAAGRVPLECITGHWPEVAPSVPVADVVVCANVAYNVADLGPFVVALGEKARARVVLTLSARHPLAPLSPLFAHFWGIDRPAGPSADDALALIGEVTGASVVTERWRRAVTGASLADDAVVARVRRRLCLPAERDEEVRAQLAQIESPYALDMVTFTWPGTAGARS